MQTVTESIVSIPISIMNPKELDFAKMCKEIRAFHKLTQQQMADKLGVQTRTYQRYEAADIEPSAKIAVAIYVMWQEIQLEGKE